MASPMQKASAESILGIALTLATVALPMTWWLRGSIVVIVAALVADLIFRSPFTVRFPRAIRIAGAIIAIVVVLATGWKPVSEEYTKEGGLNALYEFIYSETARLILVAILGGLIGNQISPARPRVWGEEKP